MHASRCWGSIREELLLQVDQPWTTWKNEKHTSSIWNRVAATHSDPKPKIRCRKAAESPAAYAASVWFWKASISFQLQMHWERCSLPRARSVVTHCFLVQQTVAGWVPRNCELLALLHTFLCLLACKPKLRLPSVLKYPCTDCTVQRNSSIASAGAPLAIGFSIVRENGVNSPAMSQENVQLKGMVFTDFVLQHM